jgi:uncharacterized protein
MGGRKMLKVEMRFLEEKGLVLEEKGLARALGVELAPELCVEPLEIHCEISKSGDLISAKGWVKGKMRLVCDRCLKEFEKPYKSFFEARFQPRDPEKAETEEEITEGEVEIVYFDGDVLDIADQVRQAVLLSIPMRVLCWEDCRGLCGGCGADLNVEACRCSEPPHDSRWSALKNWKPS